jgi:hypothetical protein
MKNILFPGVPGIAHRIIEFEDKAIKELKIL